MALRKSDIVTCVVVFGMLLMTTSCSNDDFAEHVGSALLRPQISIDATAVAVDGSVSSNLVSPVPDVADMSLKITNLSSGRQAFWSSVSEYPMGNSYLPGRYLVEAAYGDSVTEGFDCPYFYASAVVDLADGAEVDVPLVAKLASCMIQMEFTDRFKSYFTSYSAVLHSIGGVYVDYPAYERRAAFMHPGVVSVQLNLSMPSDGREVKFEAARMPNALPGYTYVVNVDVDTEHHDVPTIIVSFDSKVQTDDVVTELTQELIDSTVPQILCSGFSADTQLNWIEGTTSNVPVVMSVNEEHLKSMMLTTRCPLLRGQGWPAGVNLLEATNEQMEVMQRLGLKIYRAGGILSIDFSEVLPNLRYEAGQKPILFTLEVANSFLKLSNPVTLEVVPVPVDLKVVSCADVVAGVNTGEIVVESPTDQLTTNMELQAFVNNEWVDMPITDIESRSAGRFAVRFKAPDGTESLKARVVYRGMVKAEMTLKRVSPKYSIEVDTYALKAVVKVTPEDESLTSVITSMLRVYGNDTPLQEIDVDTEKGMLVIGGLSASTNYVFKASVMAHPSANDFCEAVTARTEDMAGFANGGFEDREKNFEYKDMSSGGRYSQNIVPIFNQQNRRSFEVYVPEKWANTNAKTASKSARNFNTWYVEPSVQVVEDAYAGTYAVMLQSVGWDLNGEDIPDYLQPNEQYTSYSCNVPNIAHRASGRLFLGSYSFNSSSEDEHYGYGVQFGSRPSALNGFYKFVPSLSDPSDRGVAVVEVLGQYRGMEIVIARTELLLRAALTYTAFSAPLTYDHFGVKATGLRVMMASSHRYGSIAEESVNVPVSYDLESAAAIGSTLWIDELSLSY